MIIELHFCKIVLYNCQIYFTGKIFNLELYLTIESVGICNDFRSLHQTHWKGLNKMTRFSMQFEHFKVFYLFSTSWKSNQRYCNLMSRILRIFSFLKECEEFQFQAKCFVPCLQDNNGRRKCSKSAKKKEKRQKNANRSVVVQVTNVLVYLVNLLR